MTPLTKILRTFLGTRQSYSAGGSSNAAFLRQYRSKLSLFWCTGSYGGCPGGWITYSGSCYKVHSSESRQSDAQADCESQGAQLTSIVDEDERHFLQTIMYLCRITHYQWRRQGEASPLWVDVQKLCNMCVLSLSWNFFVSHDKYIARPSSKEPR